MLSSALLTMYNMYRFIDNIKIQRSWLSVLPDQQRKTGVTLFSATLYVLSIYYVFIDFISLVIELSRSAFLISRIVFIRTLSSSPLLVVYHKALPRIYSKTFARSQGVSHLLQ